MAKKKSSRLKSTKAYSRQEKYLPGTLPEYEPFIVAQVAEDNRPVKIWFEDNNDTPITGMRVMMGKNAKFHLMSVTDDIPLSIKKELARTFTKWAKGSTHKKGKLHKGIFACCHFADFLGKKGKIELLSEVDKFYIFDFKQQHPSYAPVLKLILNCHPAIKNKDLSLPVNAMGQNTQQKAEETSIEDVLVDKGYSDREMMQILGFTLHRIELLKSRLSELKSVKESDLLDKGFLIGPDDALNRKKPSLGSPLNNIFLLYDTDPEAALRVFLNNLLLIVRRRKEGNPLSYDTGQPIISNLTTKIKQQKVEMYTQFFELIEKLYERGGEKGKSYHSNLEQILTLQTPLNEFTIILYILCQTGANLSVAKTISKKPNGIHWSKSFDIQLGSEALSILKKQVLRIAGYKSKGIHGAKKVDIRVPVDSYIYKVFSLYDEIYSNSSTDTFWQGINISTAKRVFCETYPIYTDAGDRFTSIDTTKIRKVFSGASLAKAVESATSGSELAIILREALNHENFDTTVMSYIMKTGLGNMIYSSAVLAMTNKLIEDALTFKGQIAVTDTKKSEAIPVYLCDCEDPFNPTHNLPISNKCTHYDLCLGCERSTVYAEHIPRICYRLLQYEKMLEPVSDIVADRRAIALDAIESFRQEHMDGDLIAEHGYQVATFAMEENLPLLPPILM